MKLVTKLFIFVWNVNTNVTNPCVQFLTKQNYVKGLLEKTEMCIDHSQ